MKSVFIPQIMLTLVLFLPAAGLGAQSLGLTPGDNGQLFPEADLEWQYGDSPWGSSLKLQGDGTSETDRTPRGPGLSQSVTTSGYHLAGQGDLIRYRLSAGEFSLTPLAGLRGDWYKITETGFVDLDDLGPVYRMFFHNDRSITALRPGAGAEAGWTSGVLSLNLGGFVAPWFLVTLDQEFSSAAAGTTLLDTPLTKHRFQGSGSWAWGGFLKGNWESGWADISAETRWEGFSLTYDYAGIGGVLDRASIDNIDGTLSLKAALKILKFQNAHPVVGVKLGWELYREAGEAAWTSETVNPKILLGVGW